MRVSKLSRVGSWLSGVSVCVAVVLVGVSTVSAETSVNVTPNPVSVTAEQSTALVQIAWNGLEPRQLVFVDICRKSIGDSSFSVAEDCGAYSSLNPNGTATGAGDIAVEVFRGQDPAGELWGCYAEGDTAPAGVVAYTTCFVRVTHTVVSNLDSDAESPIQFVGSPRVDPGTAATTSGLAPPPQLAKPPAEASLFDGATSDEGSEAEALQFGRSDAGAGMAITG